jgi:hypothetical protein
VIQAAIEPQVDERAAAPVDEAVEAAVVSFYVSFRCS